MLYRPTLRRGLVSSGATIAAIAAIAFPASAQTAAPAVNVTAAEIVVTARKTPETVLDAPLSLTALPGERLAEAGIENALDVVTLAPNVDVSGGIAGRLQGQISMRGISTLVRNIGLETGTGFFVDGVYLGRPENFDSHLLGVEQIEVLRGPQGTEFGKNTIAGIIHIKTQEPQFDPEAELRFDIGNYDAVGVQGHVTGGLSDTIAASASVGYRDRDGFYRHLSGGADADSLDLLSWRAALLFEPSDNVKFVLRGDGLRDRGVPGFFQSNALAGFPASFPSNRPHRINNNRPNQLDRDSYGLSLTGEVDFGGVTLTSVTGWRDSSFDAMLDNDQEQVDFTSADQFADNVEFFSQELRLSGSVGAFQYMVGGYYFDQQADTNRLIALGADLGIPGDPGLTTIGSVDTESIAAFARVDVRPIDPLTLSAGIRYTHETKQANFEQDDLLGVFAMLGFPDLTFVDRAKDDDWSPTVSASFAITDDVNFYARYAQGYKSAAFNVDLAMSTNGLAARPEKAASYEAGVKAQLLGGDAYVSLSVFHTDYSDLQVSQITGAGISLNNAGEATIEGLEFESVARFADFLKVEASVGLLDAEYDSFPGCMVPQSLGGGAADCSGNDLILAPEFTAHGALVFEQDFAIGNILGRIDVDHRSSVFFEPTNAAPFQGRARTLVNLRIAFTRDDWQIAGWVHNIADQDYETYIDDRSAIGVLRTRAYGEPRTYGLSIQRRF